LQSQSYTIAVGASQGEETPNEDILVLITSRGGKWAGWVINELGV